MSGIKLSIVIPCYNSYKRMTRALSFFSRNAQYAFEVIVVDDCSTDGSYEALVDYARTAAVRVRIERNPENAGPGAARNRGIREAAGEYVTFLDSDDYFTEDFFSCVFPALDGKNDCVVFDFKFLYESGREWEYASFFKKMPAGYVAPKEAVAFLRGGTCGKIYRRAVMAEHGIRFLDQRRYEDVPFTKCTVSFCSRIFYIPVPLYVYVLHAGSLTHDDSTRGIQTVINMFSYLSEHLNPEMREEKQILFIVEYLLSSSFHFVRRLSRREWVAYVKEQEALCEGYEKCRYIKAYSKSKQLELLLVRRKRYLLLRMYLWLKGKIR